MPLSLDIPLPDEGAAEWVRELQEANPSIPVLVLTTIEDGAVYEGSWMRVPARCSPRSPPWSTMEGVIAAVRRLGDGA